MNKGRVRDLLTRMIEGCGRTAREPQNRTQQSPGAPLIDVEWFQVMQSKAKACLAAMDAGDNATFDRLIGEIQAAKDNPLWVTMETPILVQLYHMGPWSPAKLVKGPMTRGRPMVTVAWEESPRGPDAVFAIRAVAETDEVLLDEARRHGFNVLEVEDA
jgi:hypothetical protein